MLFRFPVINLRLLLFHVDDDVATHKKIVFQLKLFGVLFISGTIRDLRHILIKFSS